MDTFLECLNAWALPVPPQKDLDRLETTSAGSTWVPRRLTSQPNRPSGPVPLERQDSDPRPWQRNAEVDQLGTEKKLFSGGFTWDSHRI